MKRKFSLKKQIINVVWVSPIITPLMFSTEWFRRTELLREEDINHSKTNIQENIISTDYGWLEITCYPTKAIFQLSKAGLEQSLSDLMSSIFAMFENAETHAIGINTLYEYDFHNREEWNAIGDALVPKALWQETNHSRILEDDVFLNYGMRNLVVTLENKKTENKLYNERINITYAPIRENNIDGLRVHYNHDIQVKDKNDAVELTDRFITLIHSHISEASLNDIKSHESMFNRILS
ncbi:hypothetical protein [Klebsiella pneumoniae]|uniref:hypothetical protein n=1 Tax=Klebsiella pneumoniae TaxID=573 RepID=UPI001D185D9B|nr:hypothetical protein [Klebsiella pneumoniae]